MNKEKKKDEEFPSRKEIDKYIEISSKLVKRRIITSLEGLRNKIKFYLLGYLLIEDVNNE